MPTRPIALAIALLALPLAGCLTATEGPQEAQGPPLSSGASPLLATPILSDPAGDASDLPHGTWTCEGRPPVPRPPSPLPQPPPVIPPMLPLPRAAKDACAGAVTGVVPAAPELDATGVVFYEDADSFVVALEVASLDGDFSGLVDPDEYLLYQVRWKDPAADADEPGAFERARILVALGPQGEVVFERDFRYSLDPAGTHAPISPSGLPTCSDWALCSYTPDVEVVSGTPGQIRWTIPRAVLPHGASGGTVDGVEFHVARVARSDAASVDAVRLPGRTVRDLNGAMSYVVDSAALPGSFTFTTERSGVLPTSPAFLPDPEWDTWGDRVQPEVDLLGAGFLETPSTITLALQVRRVAEQGPDLHVEFEIGIPGARIYGADLHPHDNDRIDWSSWCENENCTREVAVPVETTLVPGEPGWLNFTFARKDLSNPMAGHVPAFVEVEFYDNVGTGNEFARAYDETYDYFVFPAFRLALDSTEAPPADIPLLAQDVVGDADPTGILGFGDRNNVEITYLAAEPVDEATVVVALGVLNLSSMTPAFGDDAVLYAAALETAAGRTLVGYEQKADGAPGQFFCAEDTLLLDAQPPVAPPAHVRQPIEGSVSARGDKGTRAESGAGGTLAFRVPFTCLAAEAGRPVEVLRAAAGTFVVTRGEARPVDRVDHGPATLAFAAVVPAAPWYLSPFGIANFWDMAGVLGAVAVSGVGVALVARRRRALKRYLSDAERVERAFPDDPVRRERGLAEIRARLKEDLVRNRIHEGHFVIVERRVDAAIAQARADTFSETFKDLPHWFVVKLQKLLSDGVLSSEDYRVLAAMVEATDLPAATKAKVRTRLAGWVSVGVVEPTDAPV